MLNIYIIIHVWGFVIPQYNRDTRNSYSLLQALMSLLFHILTRIHFHDNLINLFSNPFIDVMLIIIHWVPTHYLFIMYISEWQRPSPAVAGVSYMTKLIEPIIIIIMYPDTSPWAPNSHLYYYYSCSEEDVHNQSLDWGMNWWIHFLGIHQVLDLVSN